MRGTSAGDGGLMVRDAPKTALLTMRGDINAATNILVLRSAPQARVSKDGRLRGEGRT
ncbi:hypothetical protein BRAS3809_5150025 [Bradyrhizobium sp. STM 3809]|nr:hypothetical protein BRAS3809_5150025 [Bradyrhizobium sp. STM 3809]